MKNKDYLITNKFMPMYSRAVRIIELCKHEIGINDICKVIKKEFDIIDVTVKKACKALKDHGFLVSGVIKSEYDRQKVMSYVITDKPFTYNEFLVMYNVNEKLQNQVEQQEKWYGRMMAIKENKANEKNEGRVYLMEDREDKYKEQAKLDRLAKREKTSQTNIGSSFNII